MIDDGGTAFPSHGSMGEVVQEGMTLRDYFAAHAPPVPDWYIKMRNSDMEDLIKWRWYYADAMLAEREKEA
jgi:hypothetical protein